MNVGELKKVLEGCPEEMEVFISVPITEGTEHFEIVVKHWAEGEEYDHLSLCTGDLVSG